MSDLSPEASRMTRPIVLVALVAALGGFLFGYDTAVINGVNRYLKLHFLLSPTQEGTAGASAILGAIPGAMGAGFLSDAFGRRKVLFLCAVLYAASGLLSALAGSFGGFLAARFISGLAIGASSMICPVFIAELAPARQRGRLGSLFQLGIVTGIFVTLFINAGIHDRGNEAWNTARGWRWMLAAEVAPAMMLLALLCFTPESPRWLRQFGGAAQGSAWPEESSLRELFAPRLRGPLLLAVVLMAVSQFSGINAIMYYSTKIFLTSGLGIKDAFTSSVLVGLVNLGFTLVAIGFVDRLGRRPLLLAGLGLQVGALSVVGAMFWTGTGGAPLLVAILAFIAAFAVALGPIPWIVCSEIFPTRVRGRAMAVATFVIWSSCYVVAQAFPWMNDSPFIGPARTFWIYAGCSFAGWLFVWAKMPETKGRPLEDLQLMRPASALD